MADQSRVLRGRIGALVMHSRYDARETTEKARQTFLAKFLAAVDPDGVLTPAERQRRAEYARKAHMARLAFRSAKTRSARAQGTKKTAGPGEEPAVFETETEDVAGGTNTDDELAPV